MALQEQPVGVAPLAVRRISGERRLPACRSRQLAETGKWRRLRIAYGKGVAGRAAGNYRLAACAPLNRYACVFPQGSRCVICAISRGSTRIYTDEIWSARTCPRFLKRRRVAAVQNGRSPRRTPYNIRSICGQTIFCRGSRAGLRCPGLSQTARLPPQRQTNGAQRRGYNRSLLFVLSVLSVVGHTKTKRREELPSQRCLLSTPRIVSRCYFVAS
jgi:hypothetical protein